MFRYLSFYIILCNFCNIFIPILILPWWFRHDMEYLFTSYRGILTFFGGIKIKQLFLNIFHSFCSKLLFVSGKGHNIPPPLVAAPCISGPPGAMYTQHNKPLYIYNIKICLYSKFFYIYYITPSDILSAPFEFFFSFSFYKPRPLS